MDYARVKKKTKEFVTYSATISMEKEAVIMMTDIVGFTQMTRKQESHVKKIGLKHRTILKDAVSVCGGQVMNIFGDGSLAILEDPLSAIECALAIQQSARTEPQIPMRIALHAGRVLLEGQEVYGEAINLTSRILKLGVGFSVLLSDRMEEKIRDKARLQTDSLGLFNLKYVEREVEVFGIVHPTLTLPDVTSSLHGGEIPLNSIAVLPLVFLGREREHAYLGEGISEAIIHSLTKLTGVHVTSRSSSFSIASGGRDIKEIGRLLEVAHVLEGSVQFFKNRLRVTVQLVNCRTGFHLLSESFDREMLDIFAIQEDIAWLVARRLKSKIEQQEKRHLVQPRTSNVKALDLYLQARSMHTQPSEKDIRAAIDLFRRSMEEDPAFVLPYAGISLCYTYLGALRHMEEGRAYRKANEYALKAIKIDPELPEAMVVHALCTFWISNWNLKNIEEVVVKALRMAPGSSQVRLFHGMFTLMSGRCEDALNEVLLANKLDPLNSSILSRLAYTYLCLKDYEEAHTCFRLAHNTAPFAMYINYVIAWSYLLQGKYELAESALQDVDDEVDVYQATYGTLGYIYARQGKLDKAYEQLRIIGRMDEAGRIKYPNYNYTLAYAGMKKTDEMFYHLEKSFAEKPVHLMFIQADPFWEEFRSDMRYIRIVNRVFKKTHVSRNLVLQSDTREKLEIPADQLLYIQAEDNYARVVWSEGGSRQEKVLRSTLRHLEHQLTGTAIIRCHRSYLVNLDKYELEGDSRGYKLRTTSGSLKIPVSRKRSKIILDKLGHSPHR
jgi:TolB-like protein/Tfp pilus assembly protein PilF